MRTAYQSMSVWAFTGGGFSIQNVGMDVLTSLVLLAYFVRTIRSSFCVLLWSMSVKGPTHEALFRWHAHEAQASHHAPYGGELNLTLGELHGGDRYLFLAAVKFHFRGIHGSAGGEDRVRAVQWILLGCRGILDTTPHTSTRALTNRSWRLLAHATAPRAYMRQRFYVKHNRSDRVVHVTCSKRIYVPTAVRV